MAINAIFFDNDGVLVDTERLYFRATKEIMAAEGFQLTDELFAEFFLKQSKGAWHFLIEAGVPAEKVAALKEERNRLYARYLQSEDIFIPGVRHTLEKLYGRIAMAIVTTSLGEHFSLIHERSGLLEFFDFVLTREDYEKSKPWPDPYLKALERSCRAPAECLVIEDTERGLIAAAEAGLACWLIPNPLSAKAIDARRAARVLQRIDEIPELLDGQLA